MNFFTNKLNQQGEYESIWYKMGFKEDYVETLRAYGHMPYSLAKQPLKAVKEYELLKKSNPEQIKMIEDIHRA